MRSRVFAYLLPAACLLYAQQPPAVETTDLCRIEGRVVHSITGDPARRVNLILNLASAEPATRTVASDADGRFSFENLPPGIYRLSAQRAGFVSQMYAAPSPSSVQPLRLSAGQVLKDIVIKLVPQGVIAGKVLDDEGEPVSRAMVRAVIAPGSRGRSGMAGAGTTTNDLGEYRLAELAPGRYLVMANPARVAMLAGLPASPSGPAEALLATYYPAAADQASATPLEVGPGQEVPGITVRLRKGSVYRVQGTVVGKLSSEPESRLFLQLMPRQAPAASSFMPSTGVSAVKPDGSFELRNVEPGSYYLTAMRSGGPGVVMGRMPAVVANSDLLGVVLTLRDPLRITGAIRMEGPQKADFTRTRIMLRPLEGLPINAPSAALGENQSFILENVTPDSYLVTVSPLPADAYVRSIRVGNRESGASVMDLSEAQTGATAEILVSPNGATIEGIVKGIEAPASRPFVFLVPDPPGPGSLYRMTMRPAQDGKWSIRGVAPGDYRLYAFEEMLVTPSDDPSALKPFESKAVKLTVAEGERKQVDLTVVKPPEAR